MLRQLVEYFEKNPSKTALDYSKSRHIQLELVEGMCKELIQQGVLSKSVLGEKDEEK
jgi:hypothetical protein